MNGQNVFNVFVFLLGFAALLLAAGAMTRLDDADTEIDFLKDGQYRINCEIERFICEPTITPHGSDFEVQELPNTGQGQ